MIPTQEIQKINQALPRMGESQLRELIARGTALLGGTRQQQSSQVGDEELVHEIVCDVLRARGITRPPFAVACRAPYFVEMRMGVSVLCEYVDKYVLPSTKSCRARALRVFVEMIVRNLPIRGIPVTYKTIVCNLSQIGSVVEQQFPGYRESGLLPAIVDRRAISGV